MRNWPELLALPDIDIIWIGTPPVMHSAVTVSALEAGKHVFCQARMSMDLAEAPRILGGGAGAHAADAGDRALGGQAQQRAGFLSGARRRSADQRRAGHGLETAPRRRSRSWSGRSC